MSPSPTQAFREARDFLLAQRGRHDAAEAGFRWPQLQHFNWALDWFDVMARGNRPPRCGWSTRTAASSA